MKDVIKRLRWCEHGIQLGHIQIPGAAFADDSWIAESSWHRLEQAYYTMTEGLAQYGLEANPRKSYCWSIPRWKIPEEYGDFGDLYPLQPRIPYRQEYKYLGLSYKMSVRREISWETAISKAKRLESVISKACHRSAALPITKLTEMAIQLFDTAVIYGLGTIRKRHDTNLKILDKIQARVIKNACGLHNQVKSSIVRRELGCIRIS